MTTSTTTPTFGSGTSPDEAIGECAATQLPRDAGKYCSMLTSAPADAHTYNIGPVSSEVSEKLTLEHRGAVWVVAAPEPGHTSAAERAHTG